MGSPSRHQRNPSITPTIGFREYNIRHLSLITKLLKPTGLTYKPNCTIKGMIYLKSRYLTFTAVRYKPIPNAQVKANKINRGKNIICQEGMKPYQANNKSMMQNDIPRSTKLVITELAGMIILGKYTLVIKLELPTKLPLASLKALLKNCQGSIPANTIRAYGAAPGLPSLATLLNNTVKIMVVSTGLITLQATPNTVCLYLTLISRQLSI